MMKVSKVNLLLLFLFSVKTYGSLPSEVYPQKTPLRLEGLDQQNVGSCMAEAETNAVEHFLSEKGFRVRLSTFYKHARIWAEKESDAPEQLLTDDDKEYLKSLPHIVPLYMYPEDSQSFKRVKGRIRPRIREMLVLDKSYPKNSEAFDYKNKHYTFRTKNEGRWKNFLSFEDLKLKISQRKALTMEIHSDFLKKYFSRFTGLLNKEYNYKKLMSDLSPEVNSQPDKLTHRVAIVGYDDNLYKDSSFVKNSGAIIIANSWNSYIDLKNAMKKPTLKELIKLSDMRYKVYSKKNLPAYFAVPYDYFNDLYDAPSISNQSKKGEGSVKEITFDYLSFVKIVSDLSFNYTTFYVPFSCHRKRFDVIVMRAIKKLFSSSDMTPDLMLEVFKLASINVSRSELGNTRERYFQFAKLSYNKVSGENRLEDFLQGNFNSYYCFDKNPDYYEEIFPNVSDLEDNSSLNNLINESITEPDEMFMYELLFNLSL